MKEKIFSSEMESLLKGAKTILKRSENLGIHFVPAASQRRLKRPLKSDGTISPAETAESKERKMAPLRQQALSCQACRLSQGRTNVVFGEGDVNASIVFIGEGPGREEDLQGRPFVGAAGSLLTKMIQAMGLQRDDVYIANVVKCRPPMNRQPQPDEAATCHPFLEAQLTIIRPKIICALGKTAATALLGTDAPMNTLRGQTFQWKDIPLIVTFHPAYLLRNPPAKVFVWEDLKRVMTFLTKDG